jgi:polyphosphate glucokinase
MNSDRSLLRTLSIDIGGSGIKVMVLNQAGVPQTERARVDTPHPPLPEKIIEAIVDLTQTQGNFDRISVGFPGVVHQGVTTTAANLDPAWLGFNLETALSKQFGKPVRVVNDADMQGMGAIAGQGVELMITLGTGVGSALFLNGKLVPNLEVGHHPFRKGETYEEQLGRSALEDIGQKRWNQRLKKAIARLEHLFNYDRLYIGGGEAQKVTLDLPTNAAIVSNVMGLLGGIALWKGEEVEK